MAHVQIKSPGPEGNPSIQVIVDGVDMSREMMAEPFSLDFGDPHDPARETTLTVAIACDSLDVDVPEAVLDAIRAKKPRRWMGWWR